MLHWKPNKIFFRRSHKVALVGGVTSALMPLLLTTFFNVNLKTIFRNMFDVYIFKLGCNNKTYLIFNSAFLRNN